MKVLGGISFVIFTLVWSALVVFVDMRIVPNSIKQIQSRDYPSVDGRIIDGKVTSQPGAKGPTDYTALIQYQYKLGPVVYGATRLRYDMMSSGREWANALLRKYPLGPVKVYYNPQHPGDAVLEKGVGGETLMMALFLMPFHVVMLGFWAASAAWLRYKFGRQIAGGVPIRRIGGKTRVRLSKLSTAEAGALALLGLSFGSIFFVGVTTGFHPSYQAAVAAWAVIFIGAAGFAVQRWFKIHSGKEDLLIDEGARMISLPFSFGRTTRDAVGFSSIRAVVVEKLAHSTGKGRTTYSYAPALRLKENTGVNGTIVDWYDEARAAAFAEWLRQQLGLPVA